ARARTLFMGSTYHRRFHLPQSLFAARAPLIAALLGAALWWACPAVADDLVVTGGGYGHGVGMSQEGALGYAQRGASYQAILAHYYLGTGIGRVSAGVRVKVLVGTRCVSCRWRPTSAASSRPRCPPAGPRRPWRRRRSPRART